MSEGNEQSEPCSNVISADTDSEESSDETPSKLNVPNATKLMSKLYKTPLDRWPETVTMIAVMVWYYLFHWAWRSK